MKLETEKILLRHAARYPRMQVQDAVKLLYQSEFGCGHSIINEEESLLRLKQEWQQQAYESTTPLSEDIGGGFCRVSLCVLGNDEAAVLALHRMFLASAAAPAGSIQGFAEKLDCLQRLAREERLPFSEESCAAYLEAYRREGMPAVSHSPAYKRAYDPAYRVVLRELVDYMSLLSEVERQLQEKPRVRLAIDGPCGSGKTTLAALLAKMYPCNVIAMDDFFLPPEKRTPQRLREPGGNIDYERFHQQVVQKLDSDQPFEYQAFDCAAPNAHRTRRITPKPLVICEGSYSQHPFFGSPYHIKVFVTCSPEEQSRRLLQRSGEQLHRRFLQEWIPMELIYFKTYKIKEASHFVLDTTIKDSFK